MEAWQAEIVRGKQNISVLIGLFKLEYYFPWINVAVYLGYIALSGRTERQFSEQGLDAAVKGIVTISVS